MYSYSQVFEKIRLIDSYSTVQIIYCLETPTGIGDEVKKSWQELIFDIEPHDNLDFLGKLPYKDMKNQEVSEIRIYKHEDVKISGKTPRHSIKNNRFKDFGIKYKGFYGKIAYLLDFLSNLGNKTISSRDKNKYITQTKN